MENLIARNIMTATVITAEPGTSVTDATKLMMKGFCSGLPVVDDNGHLVGVISETDILRAIDDGREPFLLKVGDIMTSPVISVDVITPVSEIVRMLLSRHVIRLPVLEGGKLKGIISRSDVLKHLSGIETDREDISFISETTRVLFAAKSRRDVIRLLVEKIGEYFGATRCSIISVDEDGGTATVLSTYEDASITDMKLDLEKYPEIKHACKTCQPVILREAKEATIMEPIKENLSDIVVKSIMVFPIVSHDKVVGTLHLRTHTDRQFTAKETRVAEMLSVVAADAIKSIIKEEGLRKMYLESEKKAIIDELTGLYNRRFLKVRLSEEFSLAQRHSIPLSCIMFDIDYFKRINDTFGHDMGDRVLRSLALCLRNSIRISDVIARYGGEEFLLVLPVTDENGALEEARRLRAVLNGNEFCSEVGKITMSMGVATYPADNVKKPEELISNADAAMYAAKEAGRDCIIAYTSLPQNRCRCK